MTARNEREAHWLKAAEAEPSWKTEARRSYERRRKRRDTEIWLLLALLVLLIGSAWWVWLT